MNKSLALIDKSRIDQRVPLEGQVNITGKWQLQLPLFSRACSLRHGNPPEYLSLGHLVPGMPPSGTNLQSTAIWTVQRRGGVCYLEAGETQIGDLQLEMLASDTSQVWRGLWDPWLSLPSQHWKQQQFFQFSRRALGADSQHQEWVRSPLGIEVSRKKKGECAHLSLWPETY